MAHIPQQNYEKELQAVQRFFKTAAGLTSFHVDKRPKSIPRPVAEFMPPFRGTDRNLTRYKYVTKVIQYGTLYVATLAEIVAYQDKLLSALEEAVGSIPVFGLVPDGQGGQKEGVIASLTDGEIAFDSAKALDVPFSLTYYVTYTRVRPPDPPPARMVGNKITGQVNTDGFAVKDYTYTGE